MRAHYNASALSDSVRNRLCARDESVVATVRKLNNFIKCALFAKFAPVIGGFDVCDLACGRGGDLQKWARLGARTFVGIDVADACIADAQARARTLGFTVEPQSEPASEPTSDFAVAPDAHWRALERLAHEPGARSMHAHVARHSMCDPRVCEHIASVLASREPGCARALARARALTHAHARAPEQVQEQEQEQKAGPQHVDMIAGVPTGPFAIVSCMFALHYAFSDKARAFAALRNIASLLHKDGVALVITTDAQELVRRWRDAALCSTHEENQGLASFSISDTSNRTLVVCSPDPAHVAWRPQSFGHCYAFTLADCVDACDEFLVHERALKDACAHANLCIRASVNATTFARSCGIAAVPASIIEAEAWATTYAPLWRAMGLHAQRPSDADWAVASLYRVFVLEHASKRAVSAPASFLGKNADAMDADAMDADAMDVGAGTQTKSVVASSDIACDDNASNASNAINEPDLGLALTLGRKRRRAARMHEMVPPPSSSFAEDEDSQDHQDHHPKQQQRRLGWFAPEPAAMTIAAAFAATAFAAKTETERD